MIARIWHGEVKQDRADEYLRLMREVALPDYRSTPGNQGAFALRRDEGGRTHVLMLTFWDSEQAIAAFAGDDIERAKYYDFDPDFLVEMEPTVTHHQAFDG
ncbi:MAG: antibiotic biosynthesis monooxygenase [Acidimicrobiales bacterium]|nr:antibiotic biosynthesis monooxygenase [Acidimicrobiales bacterium]